jgi:hypothetical protein
MKAKPGDSLCAITCFFNPGMYARRVKNYFTFIKHIHRLDILCLTVECAFADQEFQLPEDSNIIRVRAHDIMWLKERLINLGLRRVPPSFNAVAWLDCDIIFHDESWPEKALLGLSTFKVLQLFSTVHRSERDGPCQLQSFGFKRMTQPTLSYGGNLLTHGHTGFAWAADRNLLDKHGLYDLCMSGSGDHVMAHAFAGEIDCGCVNERIQVGTIHWAHFRQWAEAISRETNGDVGAISGGITHLWHGNIRDRAYSKRNQEFGRFEFDPRADVYLDESGLWRWKTHKPCLHEWAGQYFVGRKEDG